MKKTLLLVVCMVLVASAAFAAVTGVVGSKHDLSTGTATLAGANNEVCVFCHTPHNAATGAAMLAPLWSHSSGTTANNFVIYADSFGTIQGTRNQPGNVSLACLSCHDGTMAVGSIANGFYNDTATGGIKNTVGHDSATTFGVGVMTGSAALGTDLSNDHPVGITYNPTADTSLNAVVGTSVGGLPLFMGATNLQVECGSCHNVHNPTNVPFLRISNAGSALCIACHNK